MKQKIEKIFAKILLLFITLGMFITLMSLQAEFIIYFICTLFIGMGAFIAFS
jgi:hypothetical protein